MSLSRRDLLKAAGAAVGAAALNRVDGLPAPQNAMARRPLGKTGWNASIYALGSAEIPGTEEAARAIHRMIDGGVNYLDTAPSYQGTRSESAIGQILRTRRKEVFVATKTLARDAEGALREVRQSLERLQTGQVDLLQVHAVNDFATLDAVLAKGGAVEGLERAKKEGLIRFIGITGHTAPEVILRAIEKYPFATILVPVSPIDAHLSDFAREVLPQAMKQGVGIVGMKALKGIERAEGKVADPEPFLRYALSLPISTLTVGLRSESEVATNLRILRGYRQMPAREMRLLEAKVKQHADVGNLWWKRR